MAYNLNFTGDNATIAQFMLEFNNLTDGLLAFSILFTIWFMFFMAFKRGNQTPVALVSTTFITTVVAILFWSIGIISYEAFLILAPMLALSIFYVSYK